MFKVSVEKTKLDVTLDLIKSIILIVFALFGLMIDDSKGIEALSFLLTMGILITGIWVSVSSLIYFKNKTIKYWYVLNVVGIISILLAFYLYFNPLTTHEVIGRSLGIYVIVMALIYLVLVFKDKKLNLILSLGLIGLGTLAILYSKVFITTFYTGSLIATALLGVYGLYTYYINSKRMKSSVN